MKQKNIAIGAVIVLIAVAAAFLSYSGNLLPSTSTSSSSEPAPALLPNAVVQSSLPNKGITTPSDSAGYLSVGMTDPPRFSNVTSLLITITAIELHHVGNDSWVTIPLKTTIDLVKAAQIEQLLTTAKIPKGTYNIIRFKVDNAKATVQVTTKQECAPHLSCTTSTSVRLATLTLEIPSGKFQIVVLHGGFTIGTTPIHLVIDVRMNEAAVTGGKFVPTSWKAEEVKT